MQSRNRKYRYDQCSTLIVNRLIHSSPSLSRRKSQKNATSRAFFHSTDEKWTTRSKTVVEHLVADLRFAEDLNDGAAELPNSAPRYFAADFRKEVELMEIEPEWTSERQQEMDEKNKYVRCWCMWRVLTAQ